MQALKSHAICPYVPMSAALLYNGVGSGATSDKESDKISPMDSLGRNEAFSASLIMSRLAYGVDASLCISV